MGGVVKWLLAKGLGAFGYKNKKFVRSLRSHNQNSQGPTPPPSSRQPNSIMLVATNLMAWGLGLVMVSHHLIV